jgi:hypothetical protein
VSPRGIALLVVVVGVLAAGGISYAATRTAQTKAAAPARTPGAGAAPPRPPGEWRELNLGFLGTYYYRPDGRGGIEWLNGNKPQKADGWLDRTTEYAGTKIGEAAMAELSGGTWERPS